MKVTGVQLSNPDFVSKPIKSRNQSGRRKGKVHGNGVRLRKDSAVNRSSRPETPLLQWKFDKRGEDIGLTKEEKDGSSPPVDGGKVGRKANALVPAREIAASVWRLQLPEVSTAGDRLRFQSGNNHVGVPIHCHPTSKVHRYDLKDRFQSPCSVSGPRNPHFSKIDSCFQQSNFAMEGVTKWDPFDRKVSDEINQIREQQKVLDREGKAATRICALESELEQANAKIHELETEKRSSKKKLEHFLKKLDQERAAWRKKEHEKVRAIIDDIKVDLHRERKTCQKLENVNSKLVNELAEAKLTAKRYMQEFHKERKSRELIEEVCDELAKEIAEEKADVEALNRESMNFREEIEEERKMLQIAEVWREERVQMKLIDAKLALEDQYSYMNKLISDLETFLTSKGGTQNSEELRKAMLLHQAAASVNIQDFSEFTYEPPNSDDIFSIMEEVNFGVQNEKQIEQCVVQSPESHASKMHTVSPKISVMKKDIRGQSHSYVDRVGPTEEDASEWETVSHAEDQGSSYSPDGSILSVDETDRDSNMSRSGIDWGGVNVADQETPITDIPEVCSVPSRQSKKASSISRLWKPRQSNGENCKIISVDGINGRVSNGTLVSSECGSGKGSGFSPELGGQWSSPDTGNPHITKGMKGCIEWPRSAQKGNLKSKLLEARIESQKIQLRHVLKQKM